MDHFPDSHHKPSARPAKDHEATPSSACPACKGTMHPWRSKSTKHGLFRILCCKDCGSAFVSPRPTPEELVQFYGALGHGQSDERNLSAILAAEQRYPNSSVDAERVAGTLHAFLESQEHRRLLDVGCGFGFFSKAAKNSGFHVTALELASNERRVAEELAGVQALAVSFEKFGSDADSFDAIVMSQILEHAHDVELWIEKSRYLLRKGGVLAVALPNFGSVFRRLLQERDPYICPPAHLNFFTSDGLRTLLERHGFEILKSEQVSRIPPSAISKRVARGYEGIEGVVGTLVAAPLRILTSALDLAGVGMMLNIYARKIGPTARG